MYKNSPHCTTGLTPSSLMLGRKIRTKFDLLVDDKRAKTRENQTKNYSGTRTVNFESRKVGFRNPAGSHIICRPYGCSTKYVGPRRSVNSLKMALIYYSIDLSYIRVFIIPC